MFKKVSEKPLSPPNLVPSQWRELSLPPATPSPPHPSQVEWLNDWPTWEELLALWLASAILLLPSDINHTTLTAPPRHVRQGPIPARRSHSRPTFVNKLFLQPESRIYKEAHLALTPSYSFQLGHIQNERWYFDLQPYSIMGSPLETIIPGKRQLHFWAIYPKEKTLNKKYS